MPGKKIKIVKRSEEDNEHEEGQNRHEAKESKKITEGEALEVYYIEETEEEIESQTGNNEPVLLFL